MFGRKKIEELQKEIGSTISGSLIFGDYEQEMNAWNRERKIRDYREMMKDPTVEGLFNIVTMPILASEYQIVAEDENENAKKQADFVRKNLFESSFKGGIETPFDLFLDEAMLALADGFAVWEKVYRLNKDGKLELKKLALRDSLSVELEDEKGEYVGVKQTLEDGGVVEIPAYKTFLFTHNKKFNRLYGRSILNSLYKNYDKKQKLEYLDSIALQNDAIKPKILTETQEHLGAGSGAMRKIIHTIGKFGKTNSAVSVPFGYDIKTLESDGRDPHQSIERQKSEMAFAFMANFMLLGAQGKSSSGSYALSNTQAGIFQMSLQSILDKLEAHINQYIIADLIDLNFAEPHYPQFKFAKLDKSKIESIFEIFKKMVDKDKVSDEVVKQVEDEVANQLGFQIENKKQLNLSENEPTSEIAPPDKHFSNLDKKWQDIENCFLDQSRTIFESVAKGIKNTGKIELSKEYKDLLIKTFKQAYTEGKIFSANREGRKAGKDSPEFSKNAKEYIDWIFKKQENDLKQFLESESWNDTLLAEDSSDFLRNLATGVLIESVLSWFLKRAKPTASYLVGRGVNAGIYSDFKPDDLIEYSAIIDGHTTAGCSYLNGKKMTWQEWQKNPDMIPPRHFGCRATLVRVVEGGDEGENPVDKKLLERKDDFVKTPKSELVQKNPELAKYTKKELEAMLFYKSDGGYSAINNALRRGDDINPGLKARIDTLETAISKSKFESDQTIYRGFSLDRKLKVGDIVENPNFMSTSRELDVSLEFANSGAGKNYYLLEMSEIKGSPMLDIDNVLKDSLGQTLIDEDEILLNRGKSVIIESVKYNSERGIYMLNAKFTDETKTLSDKENIAKNSGEEIRKILSSIKKPVSDLSDAEKQAILDEVSKNPKVLSIHRRWLSDELYGGFSVVE